jgi:nucleoside-diphosphate kinase
MIERTLSIIKPDAVKKNETTDIIKLLNDSGLDVISKKEHQLTQKEAEGFYDIHKDRPFFNDLVKFMISGPVVVMVLEGENAVVKYREVMGATNPKDALDGTIRKMFGGKTIDENAVHGSDSLENASIEIQYFEFLF